MNFNGDLNIDFTNLPLFSYCNCEFFAKVVKIIDGDTIEIVFYESNIPRKIRLRMYGYNSPELKPSLSIENRDLHVKTGKYCSEYLKKLIENKIVKVKICSECDKYGRLLGDIFINDENINNKMINIGCIKYNGKTKCQYTSEILEKINLNKS